MNNTRSPVRREVREGIYDEHTTRMNGKHKKNKKKQKNKYR